MTHTSTARKTTRRFGITALRVPRISIERLADKRLTRQEPEAGQRFTNEARFKKLAEPHLILQERDTHPFIWWGGLGVTRYANDQIARLLHKETGAYTDIRSLHAGTWDELREETYPVWKDNIANRARLASDITGRGAITCAHSASALTSLATYKDHIDNPETVKPFIGLALFAPAFFPMDLQKRFARAVATRFSHDSSLLRKRYIKIRCDDAFEGKKIRNSHPAARILPARVANQVTHLIPLALKSLVKIDIPVLIVHGSSDTVTDEKRTREKIAELNNPNITYHQIETHHTPMLGEPQQCKELILEWYRANHDTLCEIEEREQVKKEDLRAREAL